jgi:hypothetical protein
VTLPTRHRYRAAAAALMVAAAASACGARPPSANRPPAGSASTPPTSSPGPAATGVPAPTTTTVDPGYLPQTTAKPADTSPAVTALARHLWEAVVTGNPAAAVPVFFPLAAYQQVKALADDTTDYRNRLVAHFDLDVGAAHALLGAGASTASLVGLDIPAGYVRWIPPGDCYNRVGYWFVPGSRLEYREGGQLRSFGVAALDSWRGRWYVIHLGSELPPPARGVVDAPAAGAGSFGSPGGC